MLLNLKYDVRYFVKRISSMYIYLCQCSSRMMRKSANIISGIIVIVAVTSEWGIVAEILTVLFGCNCLINSINSLQDLSTLPTVEAQPGVD